MGTLNMELQAAQTVSAALEGLTDYSKAWVLAMAAHEWGLEDVSLAILTTVANAPEPG